MPHELIILSFASTLMNVYDFCNQFSSCTSCVTTEESSSNEFMINGISLPCRWCPEASQCIYVDIFDPTNNQSTRSQNSTSSSKNEICQKGLITYDHSCPNNFYYAGFIPLIALALVILAFAFYSWYKYSGLPSWKTALAEESDDQGHRYLTITTPNPNEPTNNHRSRKHHDRGQQISVELMELGPSRHKTQKEKEEPDVGR